MSILYYYVTNVVSDLESEASTSKNLHISVCASDLLKKLCSIGLIKGITQINFA